MICEANIALTCLREGGMRILRWDRLLIFVSEMVELGPFKPYKSGTHHKIEGALCS